MITNGGSVQVRPLAVVVFDVGVGRRAQRLIGGRHAVAGILHVRVVDAGAWAVVLNERAGAPRCGLSAGEQGEKAAAVDVACDGRVSDALERGGKVDVLHDLGAARAGRDAGAGDHQRHDDVMVERGLLAFHKG
ncbi:hypothetical protein [Dactylosporangium sp. NPDC006015]|uniref:hypothetical protein n=1 Tax=Dactylosporangium sp. NPDC006015 TaxID=3154576 RepID=UPI0033A89B3E